MISTEQPIITPATDAISYDTWWLVTLMVQSGQPNIATTAEAVFRLANVDEYGVVTFYTDENGKYNEQVLKIGDLFGMAAVDVGISNLVNSVVDTIGAIAKAQNVII